MAYVRWVNYMVSYVSIELSEQNRKGLCQPTHVKKYFSGIKRNKVSIHTTTWMDLKRALQVEDARPKTLHAGIPVIQYSGKGQTTGRESTLVVCQGLQVGQVSTRDTGDRTF